MADSGASSEGATLPSEFDRFRKLTERLVKVPKSDLGKARVKPGLIASDEAEG